jgi:hypothetical protein
MEKKKQKSGSCSQSSRFIHRRIRVYFQEERGGQFQEKNKKIPPLSNQDEEKKTRDNSQYQENPLGIPASLRLQFTI